MKHDYAIRYRQLNIKQLPVNVFILLTYITALNC